MSQTKNPMNQYRGAVSRAQGRFFESAIDAACVAYLNQERAVIQKTPEPFHILKPLEAGRFIGNFEKKAQPDYQGTICGSGESIVFEAKYTTTDRLLQSVLTDEQSKRLELHNAAGARTAVCCGIGNDFFFVPWYIWREMKQFYGHKYIKPEDVEQYRIKFNGAVMFLDYIH